MTKSVAGAWEAEAARALLANPSILTVESLGRDLASHSAAPHRVVEAAVLLVHVSRRLTVSVAACDSTTSGALARYFLAYRDFDHCDYEQVLQRLDQPGRPDDADPFLQHLRAAAAAALGDDDAWTELVSRTSQAAPDATSLAIAIRAGWAGAQGSEARAAALLDFCRRLEDLLGDGVKADLHVKASSALAALYTAHAHELAGNATSALRAYRTCLSRCRAFLSHEEVTPSFWDELVDPQEVRELQRTCVRRMEALTVRRDPDVLPRPSLDEDLLIPPAPPAELSTDVADARRHSRLPELTLPLAVVGVTCLAAEASEVWLQRTLLLPFWLILLAVSAPVSSAAWWMRARRGHARALDLAPPATAAAAVAALLGLVSPPWTLLIGASGLIAGAALLFQIWITNVIHLAPRAAVGAEPFLQPVDTAVQEHLSEATASEQQGTPDLSCPADVEEVASPWDGGQRY